MTMTTIILVHIGFAVWFFVGYKAGQTKERKDWNKLIQNGTIPPPCPPETIEVDEVNKE
jgi:hypothetical protein